MFTGVCTALVTPFDKNGKIDYKAYEKLLNFQIKNGVDALLVCGTTGEPATMSETERKEVVEFVINTVNKRVPVYVGTGSNNTAHAVELSLEAQNAGADALLVVTPYYNKCTQAGLIEYYRAISNHVNIPIIAYNVPGRTGVNIKPETCFELSKIKNMAAIKEASGNMEQIEKTKKLIRDTGMLLYSGDDALTLPMLALGCDGVISVASNAIPQPMHDLVEAFNSGDIKKAQDIHFKYVDFMDGIFFEVNPIPIKYALSKMGLCENILRSPLTPMENATSKNLFDIMKEIKLV